MYFDFVFLIMNRKYLLGGFFGGGVVFFKGLINVIIFFVVLGDIIFLFFKERYCYLYLI